MRQRDSVKQGEELARIVAWLRRRALLLHECADALAGHGPDEVAAAIIARCRSEAEALRDAALRLETGEHRDGR